MTAGELDRNEKEAFMTWRKKLAEYVAFFFFFFDGLLCRSNVPFPVFFAHRIVFCFRLEENENLLLTPFEKNVEVWRQLWRVIERSDLIVQILDARDPLLFRSVDLEKYIDEFKTRKNGRQKKIKVLLLNKADLLTAAQRKHWADYFRAEGIRFAFFSAFQEQLKLDEALKEAKLQQALEDGQEDEQQQFPGLTSDIPNVPNFNQRKAAKNKRRQQLEQLVRSMEPRKRFREFLSELIAAVFISYFTLARFHISFSVLIGWLPLDFSLRFLG